MQTPLVEHFYNPAEIQRETVVPLRADGVQADTVCTNGVIAGACRAPRLTFSRLLKK